MDYHSYRSYSASSAGSAYSQCAEAVPSGPPKKGRRRTRPAGVKPYGSVWYTCTYYGCTERFETPALLQNHKLEVHCSAHVPNGAPRPLIPYHRTDPLYFGQAQTDYDNDGLRVCLEQRFRLIRLLRRENDLLRSALLRQGYVLETIITEQACDGIGAGIPPVEFPSLTELETLQAGNTLLLQLDEIISSLEVKANPFHPDRAVTRDWLDLQVPVWIEVLQKPWPGNKNADSGQGQSPVSASGLPILDNSVGTNGLAGGWDISMNYEFNGFLDKATKAAVRRGTKRPASSSRQSPHSHKVSRKKRSTKFLRRKKTRGISLGAEAILSEWVRHNDTDEGPSEIAIELLSQQTKLSKRRVALWLWLHRSSSSQGLPVESWLMSSSEDEPASEDGARDDAKVMEADKDSLDLMSRDPSIINGILPDVVCPTDVLELPVQGIPATTDKPVWMTGFWDDAPFPGPMLEDDFSSSLPLPAVPFVSPDQTGIHETGNGSSLESTNESKHSNVSKLTGDWPEITALEERQQHLNKMGQRRIRDKAREQKKDMEWQSQVLGQVDDNKHDTVDPSNQATAKPDDAAAPLLVELQPGTLRPQFNRVQNSAASQEQQNLQDLAGSLAKMDHSRPQAGNFKGHDKMSARSRRIAQNRAAQRAFRERKERIVKDLEKTVAALQEAQAHTAIENLRLKHDLQKLTTGNEISRAADDTSGSPNIAPHDPDPASQPGPKGKSNFQCTFCHIPLTEGAWKRHEESQHLPRTSWTCMGQTGMDRYVLEKADTGDRYHCVFCCEIHFSLVDILQHGHTCHSKITECMSRPPKDRTFLRRDNLQQHLQQYHKCVHPILPAYIAAWENKGGREQSWTCGFCGEILPSWAVRATHLKRHFREGATMKEWIDDWHKLSQSLVNPELSDVSPDMSDHTAFDAAALSLDFNALDSRTAPEAES